MKEKRLEKLAIGINIGGISSITANITIIAGNNGNIGAIGGINLIISSITA